MPDSSEAYRLEYECRQWAAWYQERVQAGGVYAAKAWWKQAQNEIRKQRGQAGLDYLLNALENMKNEQQKTLAGTDIPGADR